MCICVTGKTKRPKNPRPPFTTPELPTDSPRCSIPPPAICQRLTLGLLHLQEPPISRTRYQHGRRTPEPRYVSRSVPAHSWAIRSEVDAPAGYASRDTTTTATGKQLWLAIRSPSRYSLSFPRTRRLVVPLAHRLPSSCILLARLLAPSKSNKPA